MNTQKYAATDAFRPLEVPFPKERMDAMAEFARTFNPASPRLDHDLPWQLPRMDSDTIFLARELEEIRAGLHEVQYGKLKAQRLTPWNTSINRGVVDYTVRALDHKGTPVAAKGREDQIPTLTLQMKAASIKFESFYLAYEYSLQDAHEAAYANMPLSANLAMMCRERMARKLDQIALVGDQKSDDGQGGTTSLTGIFNQSGTLTYTPLTTGSGGSKLFSTKNSDDIIADMAGPINKIISTTLEVESPDTMVIPVSIDVLIAQKRVGDGTSWTIKQFFKENHPDVTLERSSYLETLGSGSTTRMVAYQNHPTRFEILVSVVFDQTAPQFHGLGVKTITEFRTAGCALYLPESVCISDGQ